MTMLRRISLAWERFSFPLRAWLQLALAATMHALERDRFRESDFEITELPIEIPGLDPLFDGYRIVQIADLHLGHWLSPERLRGVVELINRQEPDLVVITGDFVSYVVHQIADEMIAAFQALRPKDATLAVLGNHDHWMGAENVRAILQAGGVIELANAVYTVVRGESGPDKDCQSSRAAALHIAGVDSVTVGAADLDAVLAQLPDNAPAILLAHEPDYADISAATGRFALQLSGHSHGGQIVLPRVGALLRGPGFFKYPNGLYRVGEMWQYTNRGVGTHVFRVRYACPAEITLVILRAPRQIPA
jgi:predicted MPP superfamily phosphohydrolase